MKARSKARLLRGVSTLLVLVFLTGLCFVAIAGFRPQPAEAVIGIDDAAEVVALGAAVDAVYADAMAEAGQQSLPNLAAEYGATPGAAVVARQIACGLLAALLAAGSAIPAAPPELTQYNGVASLDPNNKMTGQVLNWFAAQGKMSELEAVYNARQLVDGAYWFDLGHKYDAYGFSSFASDGNYHLTSNIDDSGLAAAVSTWADGTTDPGGLILGLNPIQSNGLWSHPWTADEAQIVSWAQTWSSSLTSRDDQPLTPVWEGTSSGGSAWVSLSGFYDRVTGNFIRTQNYGGSGSTFVGVVAYPQTCPDGWVWGGSPANATALKAAIQAVLDRDVQSGWASMGETDYGYHDFTADPLDLPEYAAVPQSVLDGGNGNLTTVATGQLYPDEGKAIPLADVPTTVKDHSSSSGGSGGTGTGTSTTTDSDTGLNIQALIDFLTSPLQRIVAAVEAIYQWCVNFFTNLTVTVRSWVEPSPGAIEADITEVQTAAEGVWPFAAISLAGLLPSMFVGDADVQFGVYVTVWPENPRVVTYVDFRPWFEYLEPLRSLAASVVWLMLIWGLFGLVRPQVEV